MMTVTEAKNWLLSKKFSFDLDPEVYRNLARMAKMKMKTTPDHLRDHNDKKISDYLKTASALEVVQRQSK